MTNREELVSCCNWDSVREYIDDDIKKQVKRNVYVTGRSVRKIMSDLRSQKLIVLSNRMMTQIFEGMTVRNKYFGVV